MGADEPKRNEADLLGAVKRQARNQEEEEHVGEALTLALRRFEGQDNVNGAIIAYAVKTMRNKARDAHRARRRVVDMPDGADVLVSPDEVSKRRRSLDEDLETTIAAGENVNRCGLTKLACDLVGDTREAAKNAATLEPRARLDVVRREHETILAECRNEAREAGKRHAAYGALERLRKAVARQRGRLRRAPWMLQSVRALLGAHSPLSLEVQEKLGFGFRLGPGVPLKRACNVVQPCPGGEVVTFGDGVSYVCPGGFHDVLEDVDAPPLHVGFVYVREALAVIGVCQDELREWFERRPWLDVALGEPGALGNVADRSLRWYLRVRFGLGFTDVEQLRRTVPAFSELLGPRNRTAHQNAIARVGRAVGESTK